MRQIVRGLQLQKCRFWWGVIKVHITPEIVLQVKQLLRYFSKDWSVLDRFCRRCPSREDIRMGTYLQGSTDDTKSLKTKRRVGKS